MGSFRLVIKTVIPENAPEQAAETGNEEGILALDFIFYTNFINYITISPLAIKNILAQDQEGLRVIFTFG